MARRPFAAACIGLLAVAGCSRHDDSGAGNAQVPANMAPAAIADSPSSTPSAAASATPPAGFDPASAPISTATLGAFPYFGLLDGYVPLTPANAPTSAEYADQKDVGFDRYEFFDGTKIVPVEGRLRTVQALGKGASFLEVQKNYETLVHNLGGVTVYEGSGRPMVDRKLTYADPRHRGHYNALGDEQMGVYLLRVPGRAIWVEVYKAYELKPDNYWLTVVEEKKVDVTAKLLPAEEMKKALDTAGHVALYVNFDTDRTAIKPDSQPLLAEVVKLLQGNPGLRLTIEGHTDDAGTPAHNQTLSLGRANAVMGQLIAQGIDPARLQARGFGQTRPIADNATEDGKAKNRRVELVKR